MSPAVLVAVGVAGLCYLVSGAAMLVAGRARVAASLLAGSGAALTAGAWLRSADHRSAGAAVLTVGCVLVPLCLECYPTLRVGHPVDFVAVVTMAGSCLVVPLTATRDVVAPPGLVILLVLFAHTWWRIEHTTGREQRALQWMALAVGSTGLAAMLLTLAAESYDVVVVVAVLLALIGPGLYVGVTLPDVVDVRALVVGAVVLAVAAICYLAVFMLLALSFAGLLGRDLSLGALGLLGALVAATFHPLQVLLRGVVDALLFGERPDPLHAASHVAGRVGNDPLEALRAIREALVLPYAAVVVDGVPVAVSGASVTHTRTFVLEGLGELVVGLRAGDLRFTPGDEQVLRLTAPLLAQTLRARSLAAELQGAQEVRVAAVEEERRRLRRDLHDGLGPRLSGIAFTSDAVRNLVHDDPHTAYELLATLRAETTVAIDDIRRLVYGMRPPALDELGLVPALRQQALSLRGRDGHALSVTVSAPDDLPGLPAAVEVATYRIVAEALTNVARHSACRSAAVALWPGPDGLRIDVTDDGGEDQRAADWSPGVGLSSMRERATELGGTLTAGPSPTGGHVRAVLPLPGR